MRPLHKTELPLFSDRKVQAAHETAQNEDSEPKASAHNRIAMLAAVYKIVNPSAVYMGAFVDRKLLGQVDEAVVRPPLLFTDLEKILACPCLVSSYILKLTSPMTTRPSFLSHTIKIFLSYYIPLTILNHKCFTPLSHLLHFTASTMFTSTSLQHSHNTCTTWLIQLTLDLLLEPHPHLLWPLRRYSGSLLGHPPDLGQPSSPPNLAQRSNGL